MKETDKDSSNRSPLEIAQGLEDLLRGSILVFLRMFYTIYRYFFTRRQFPLQSEADPLSPSIVVGPVTFAVFSWILYLFIVDFVFIESPAPFTIRYATSLFSDALASGNLFKFLLSFAPLLILLAIIATLQQIICQVFRTIVSFSTNLAISGYVIGAYAVMGSLVNLSFLLFINPENNEIDLSAFHTTVMLLFILLWAYRWFRMLIEDVALSRKQSFSAVVIVSSFAALTIWGTIESIPWILSRFASS